MTQLDRMDGTRPFVVVEHCGVLINGNITAAEYAVLDGYAEILRYVDRSAPLRYLTAPEVNNVLGMEGRRYRISAK